MFRIFLVLTSLISFCSILYAAPPAGVVIGWGFNGNGEVGQIKGAIQISSTNVIFFQTNSTETYIPREGSMSMWTYYETSSPFSIGVVTIEGKILTNAIAVSGGNGHALALKSDGTVVGWGLNKYGQATGVPSESPTNGQVTIEGIILSNVVAISAGYYDSLALKNNGTVVRWGGQPVYPPQIFPKGFGDLKTIAGGFGVGLGIKSNGVAVGLDFSIPEGVDSPVAWARLPSGGTLSNIVAVAPAGDGYPGLDSLALKKDGTVIQWDGFAGKPSSPNVSNVVAIAVGAGNYLALKNDGTVFGWGENHYGQATGIPTEQTSSGIVTICGTVLSNVLAITSAGRHEYNISHSMALKRDGTIVTWGNFGRYHIANVPIGLSNVVSIASGGNDSSGFCLAITTNCPSLLHLQPH